MKEEKIKKEKKLPRILFYSYIIVGVIGVLALITYFCIDYIDPMIRFKPLKYLHEKYNIAYDDMELVQKYYYHDGCGMFGCNIDDYNFKIKLANIKIKNFYNGRPIKISYSRQGGYSDNYKKELGFSEKSKKSIEPLEQYIKSYINNYGLICKRNNNDNFKYIFVLDIRDLKLGLIKNIINNVKIKDKFNDYEIYLTYNMEYFDAIKKYDYKNDNYIIDFFNTKFIRKIKLNSSNDNEIYTNLTSYLNNQKIIYKYDSIGSFEVYEAKKLEFGSKNELSLLK